jgi:hypothetical protein
VNAVERHCTCGASLRAKATSSLIVDRVADLFSDYHTGEGHGTATAQQARNARRREERALAQGSCVMTSPTEAPPAPEADGWVRVADLLPSRARDLPWTWGDEERNTLTRQCLCCGRPGHYQQTLEAHIAEHGLEGLGILVEDGYVADGHHRVVAAIRLGIDRLPVETGPDAQARWVKDHGHVDWSQRKFGDR